MMAARTFRNGIDTVLRQIAGPVLGAFVVGYFAYHTVQGDRGLLALTHLQSEVVEAERVLALVRADRLELEQRTALLRPDNLSVDMLEERSRILLNQAHPDELVILLPGRPAPLPAQGQAAE